MSHTPFDDEAGFTLIETLVALSILSLMSLLAFATLRIGTGLWVRVGQNSDAVSEVAVVQDLLRRTIEQAYPAVIPMQERGYVVSFNGTQDSLELTATLPREIAIGGLRRIRIAREAAQGRGPLVLRSRMERNLAEMAALPEPEQRIEVVPDMRAIVFAYYGVLGDDEKADWHAQWSGQKHLPQLVRVELTPAAGNRHWPPQTVAPRVTVDATCVLDPLTKQCRGR